MENMIRTEAKLLCKSCGSDGTYLYKSLKDRLFGVSGDWNLKQCNNALCGLIWLDPAPLEEDIYKAYHNYYTHVDHGTKKVSLFSKLVSGYRAYQYGFLVNKTTYLTRFIGRLLGYSGFIKEHMDYPFVYFKNQPKGKLLELGSGSGATLKLFNDWGWQAEGLDFDEQAVKNGLSKGLNVHHGDVFSQNFDSNTFDAIFSSHVIEHVPDPQLLLQESFRILKPGGIFVAVMPNSSSKLHQAFKSDWRGLEPPRHLHIFNPQSLDLLTKKINFKSVKIKTGNYSAVGVWLMSYKIRKYGTANMFDSSLIRYLGHLVRFYLNLTHRFSPSSGEELILIAYK